MAIEACSRASAEDLNVTPHDAASLNIDQTNHFVDLAVLNIDGTLFSTQRMHEGMECFRSTCKACLATIDYLLVRLKQRCIELVAIPLSVMTVRKP